jgi:predicted ATPase
VLKIWNQQNATVPFADSEPLFGTGFCYLGAEHIGPLNEYSASQWNREGLNPLGKRGEYAVPFLALEGDRFRVPGQLCLPTGKTNRLFDQVTAWISELSPGVKIGARYNPFEERAKLDISYSGQRLDSALFLPVNVGFGIHYVLPLVVALLTADPNGILIVENPESHLHPRGQSRMANLIARVAGQGTQVICESHSDHIINGIRIAVKEKVIKSSDLAVIYFDKDEDQITYTTEIVVDRDGNLSDYPEGLLDEWGIQMSALI